MSYEYEDLHDVSPIVFDLETMGLPNAADYLEPVQAAKNLKDPAKIQADIEQRTADRDAKLALDWNVGRVAAIGWWTELEAVTLTCEDESLEAVAIQTFWDKARRRTIVGYNAKGFDLRFLIQRSRYLGLQYPTLDLGRYGKRGQIIDLYLDLTFNEPRDDQGAMRRTLHAFCRRFGIPVDDTIQGADVPMLAAAGEWNAIAAHCASDVQLTLALARKLGVVKAEVVPA